jgi:hypothetical protein
MSKWLHIYQRFAAELAGLQHCQLCVRATRSHGQVQLHVVGVLVIAYTVTGDGAVNWRLVYSETDVARGRTPVERLMDI